MLDNPKQYKKDWYARNREQIRTKESLEPYKKLRNERIYLKKLLNKLANEVISGRFDKKGKELLYFAYNQSLKVDKLKVSLVEGGKPEGKSSENSDL